jgi:cation:H+ antiporter
MTDILLIIAGFALLIFCAGLLVDGSSGLAKRFNMSDLIIGLTVVAFGTSAPELVVNIVAALDEKTTDIALTNIIGSNMVNVYIILGIAALVFPITSRRSSRIFDIPLSILAPLMVLLLCFDGTLNIVDGIIFLLIFAIFLYTLIRKSLKNPEITEEIHFKPMKIWKALIMITFGLAGLIGGAQMIVPAATNIATAMGVSQSLIGLTIVALGTSLPELATSVVAAFKKNSDIALGNVIGSNIFNVFFILGASALIRPLPVYKGITEDLTLTILAAVLILVFIFSNKSRKIPRWGGAAFIIIYILYILWKISIQS